MKITALPTFDMTLPITQQKVQFRPFVMKEEKVLLMASEGTNAEGIVTAIDTCVKNCTNGAVSCATHSMVDVQYAFLQIRGKSISETMEFNLVCGKCGHSTPGTLNIDEVKVQTSPEHTPIIALGNEVVVTMRYPSMQHLGILSKDDASVDEIYTVIADCIDKIQTVEEVYDRANTPLTDMLEFVDNLTSAQFALLRDFFQTMPVITHRISYTCTKCETPNVIELDEITNFFV